MDPNKENPQEQNTTRITEETKNPAPMDSVTESVQNIPLVQTPVSSQVQPPGTITSQEVQTPTQELRVQPKEPIKKKSPMLAIALILFLIAILTLAGYFLWTKYLGAGKPVATPTPIAVAAPKTTPDPTADWKTYTNTSDGYLIKYPNTFVRYECPNEELTLGINNNNISDTVVMEGCERDTRYTLETKTYDTVQNEPSSSTTYTVTKKDIKLGDLEAEEYTFVFNHTEEGPFPEWFTEARVNKDGKTYEIYLGNKDLINIYDQILSTFKFIEASPSSMIAE